MQRAADESTKPVDPVRLAAYVRALAQLDPANRQAFVARFEQGLGYERIAAAKGGSAESARRQVSDAIRQLLDAVFGAAAVRPDRISSLLDTTVVAVAGTPAVASAPDMTVEEQGLVNELLDLLVASETQHSQYLDGRVAPGTVTPVPARWGKFTIQGVIDKGGFGTVYRAWDPDLQHPVALKLYHPEISRRPKDELLSEARKLARVRHPNVVVVHGAEEHRARCSLKWNSPRSMSR